MISIRNVKLNYNKNLFKIDYSFQNYENKSFSFNGTIQSLAVISKALLYYKLKIPENENDKNFKKEFINTVVDLEKSLKGNQNEWLSMIRDEILKRIDFEIKFPMEKVRILNGKNLK